MTRVLLIGIKPEAVDFSDPDLPTGTTAEKIAAGIDVALSDMKARGWEGAFCSIRTMATIRAKISHIVHQERYWLEITLMLISWTAFLAAQTAYESLVSYHKITGRFPYGLAAPAISGCWGSV